MQGWRNLEARPEGGGRAVIADLGTVTRKRPQNGTGAERSRVDGERGGIGRGQDGKEQGGGGTIGRHQTQGERRAVWEVETVELLGVKRDGGATPKVRGTALEGRQGWGDGGGDTGSLENEPA